MTNLPALIFAFFLMTSPNGQLHIEPGKQLPQSVAIRNFTGSSAESDTVRFLLFTPKGYSATGAKWPLMLFLHGLGECSDDDLERVKIHGPAKIVETRPDFPFVLVSPQCPLPKGYDSAKPIDTPELKALIHRAWKPDQLIRLIDHVAGQLNIDQERVYVTGLSMGGYGAWRLAATYPDRFAAAVPICGGGEPAAMAKSLARVPIWAFHGAKDSVVPTSESQKMVDAVRAEHGDVQLTVYPGVEHNSWAPAYDNAALYDWLLAHRRTAR